MRVLGIDPAAAGATGYGVVETGGRGFRVLGFGAVEHARAAAPAARLRAVHARVAELMEEFAPDAVAVEAVFTALNMKTAIRLAEVRGVVLLAAAQHDLPVHSYAPREVKASVAGHGNADKFQVQQMVRAALGLRQVADPKSFGTDAADALAVALCHIHCAQARERFTRATGVEPPAPAKPGPERNGTRARRRIGSRSRVSRIQVHR